MDIDRQLGNFSIANDVIRGSPALARKILRGCIVVRAEQRYEMDAIEYTAIHSRFDPVRQGCMAPYYHIQIITPGNIVKWTKA